MGQSLLPVSLVGLAAGSLGQGLWSGLWAQGGRSGAELMGQIKFYAAELIGRAEACGAGLIEHICGAQCGNWGRAYGSAKGSVGQNGIVRAQWDLWGREGSVRKNGIYGAEERRRVVGQKEFYGIERELLGRVCSIGQESRAWCLDSLWALSGTMGQVPPPLLYPSPLPLFQEFFRGRGGAGESS